MKTLLIALATLVAGQAAGKQAFHQRPVNNDRSLVLLAPGDEVGFDPGANAPGAIKILALSHIEFGVSHPITDRAFVHDGQTGHMFHRFGLSNSATRTTNHQDDLAFIIKLFGFLWNNDRSTVGLSASGPDHATSGWWSGPSASGHVSRSETQGTRVLLPSSWISKMKN